MHAEHPPPSAIIEAAMQYLGNRTRNWHPNPAIRPLNVLRCQRNNLGWGAPIHHVYATVVTFIFVGLLPIDRILTNEDLPLTTGLSASTIATIDKDGNVTADVPARIHTALAVITDICKVIKEPTK